MESSQRIAERLRGYNSGVPDKGYPVNRTSNHTAARRRPRGWHQNLRRTRKLQKRARRARRGKR